MPRTGRMAEHFPDELALGYCQVIAERGKSGAGSGKNILLIMCFSICGGKVKTAGSIP